MDGLKRFLLPVWVKLNLEKVFKSISNNLAIYLVILFAEQRVSRFSDEERDLQAIYT